MNKLAYWDTFSGLIPCKVIDATKFSTGTNVKIRLTASRGPYKKGEVREVSHLWVVPRKNVRRHKYGTTIVGGWDWAK